jgi:hypothetical protein
MKPSGSSTRANGLRGWLRRLLTDDLWGPRFAPAILVLAGIAMLGLLLYVSRWLTFWFDEWTFVVYRPDPSVRTIVEPHVDTFLATLALIYEALLHVFGLRTYEPYLLVDWLMHFVCVGLLYHIVARRSGTVLGLMAGLSLLLLGSAYEDLLQPFQMQYLLAGAGGLLALDRLLVVEAEPAKPHRERDLIVAALALLFAVASSSLGPIFVGLIVVWAVLRRDRAALLATAPAIALYVVWYVMWVGEFQRPPTAGMDFLLATESLLYGLGSAVCGVAGLPPQRFGWVGTLLLAAAAVGVAVAVIRGLRPAPLAAAAFLALIAEYGLQAFLRGSMGVEHAARSGYLYPAALFIWLAISGVVGHGLDRERWIARGRLVFVPVAVLVLIVPMAMGNMAQFVGAARQSKIIRATEVAELRLVEAVRSIPGVDLDVSPDPDYIPQLTGRTYLAAIERFGAPTLAWDWESSADSTRVNLTAVRLLGPSIRIVAPPGSGGSAPQLEIKGGSVEAGTSSGCSLVRPSSPDAAVSMAIEDGHAFWLQSPPAGVLLMVGVADKPSAAIDGSVRKALANGQAVVLPTLPAPYGWQVRLESLGTQSFEVCSAAP